MEDALLREQVLTGFLHVPKTSIPVCLRMSRGIQQPYAQVAQCVSNLVQDGLLARTDREGRLPPLYEATATAHELSEREEYLAERSLSSYEYKTLQNAKRLEVAFAHDQDVVIAFMQQHENICVSTLMIQDLLRTSVEMDNIIHVNSILAQLAYNDEIESTCKQMLWKLKPKKPH